LDREGLVRGTAEGDERLFEQTLRPRRLSEYIGQERVKANLAVFLPPGLGKTTLAYVVAHEMDVQIRVTSGPAIEKPGDLAAILTNLQPGDVLFLDEIHRLSRTMEEILYPAMEDFALDLVIGSGPAARTVRLDLPRFTLVGATTRVGSLTAPLRDRFGIVHHLDYYRADDLETIAMRSAGILAIDLERGGAREIAKRARGTPRVANRLLRRVRDFAQVDGSGAVTDETAASALERLEVDRYGLDMIDRRILTTILDKFAGGPVGLSTLAAAVGEDRGTIEEIYEPYLLQIGFLDRTPRGRRATIRARQHLQDNTLL
jgi:Holliday junction DNA helicase RuvB